MSALQYLKKAYASIEVHEVVDALLRPTQFQMIEDGRFLEIIVRGNKRVKIPSNLGSGSHFELAEKLLLEWGVRIGASWALANAPVSPLHDRMAMRFRNRISPPMVLEQLFMVQESTLRQLISTLVLRLQMSAFSTTIERAFSSALETPWKLDIDQSIVLGNLCCALGVATVQCAKQHASFIIEGKGYLKCSQRDLVLLTLVILGLKCYNKIELSDLVRLSQLTSALRTLYPSHNMSSPTKRFHNEDESPSKRGKPEQEEAKPAYSYREWREYTADAVEAVKSYHGVPDHIPPVKFEGDSEGKRMSLTIEGCAPGTYNQVLKFFCPQISVFMPNTGGTFSVTDKLAFKLTGEEGADMAGKLKTELAKGLAGASNLSHFLAKVERAQLKKMSPEERTAWVLNKINEGDWTIPINVSQEVDDETGAISFKELGIKARSGFGRTKKGATGADYAKAVAENITTDPGVLAAAEAQDGKEFSPPDMYDAVGNRIPWKDLTEGGTLTRFSFAGVVEVQLLGFNKIEQKSTASKSFATMPTKVSVVRLCRLRPVEGAQPKADMSDKRVALF